MLNCTPDLHKKWKQLRNQIEPIDYHWEIVRQGSWQTEFTDTYFLSAQEGWAIGDDGTILRTTNGGSTWQPQQSGVTEELAADCFH